MKLWLALFAVGLFSTSTPPGAPPAAPPASPSRSPYGLGLYDGYQTPAFILRGLAITESDEHDSALGDDGISEGRMQINERFHRERARLYGDYNPREPLDAIRIASCLYQANLRALGSGDEAIAAHRQGVSGVQINGPAAWYIARVKGNEK